MLCVENLLLRARFVVTLAPGIKLCVIAAYRLFHSHAQVLILLTRRGEQEYTVRPDFSFSRITPIHQLIVCGLMRSGCNKACACVPVMTHKPMCTKVRATVLLMRTACGASR